MTTTTSKSNWGLLLVLMLLASFGVNAQQVLKADKASKMTIEGTSTLHDWTEDVTIINGKGEVALSGNQVSSISGVELTIPIEGIESEMSAMDTKTYDALKKDDHPNISYKLTKVTQISGNNVKALGYLTIAGVTRTVELNVNYKVLGNGRVEFTGEKALKMTDFGVAPPTAMFGSIKAGDDITIKFDMIFSL